MSFFIAYLIPLGLFISLCWAISPIMHKYVLKRSGISPKTILILSTLFYTSCVAIFALIHWETVSKDLPKMDFAAWLIIGVTTVIAGFWANVLYFYMIRDNASSTVAALIYSSPIFTLLLAYIFINEMMSVLSLAGVLLIVTGVICIALG